MKWEEMGIAEKAGVIKMFVENGVEDVERMRKLWDSNVMGDGGKKRGMSSGEITDALWESRRAVDGIGNTHYEEMTTIPDRILPYIVRPDERGHYSDLFKTWWHPSSPERGRFAGDGTFTINDRALNSSEGVNYTLFGLPDNGDGAIKVISKDGIMLPEIRVTPKGSYVHNTYDDVKLYAPGGDLDKPPLAWKGEFVKSPAPNSDRDIRISSDVQLPQDKYEWVKNWYANRQRQVRENNGFDMVRFRPDDTLRAVDSIPMIHNDEQSREYLDDTTRMIYDSRKERDDKVRGYHYFGNRDMGAQPFIRLTDQASDTTDIHEHAHAMQAQGGRKQEKKIAAYDYEKKDKYKDSPGEIYSRLMQLRYKYNIDPKKKWDKSSLQELKKQAKGNGYNVLDRYDDDFLMYLFNEVADNGSSDVEIPNYAAFGGHLFAPGGSLDDPPENHQEYNDYLKMMGLNPINEDNFIYLGNKGLPLDEINIIAKRSDKDYSKLSQNHAKERALMQDKIQNRPGWQLASVGALLPAAIMSGPTIMSTLNNPYVDALFTLHSATTIPKQIKGIVSDFNNGEYLKGVIDSGLASMDLYGASKFIKGASHFLNPNIRRQAAYATIDPWGYSDVYKRFKDFSKSVYYKDFTKLTDSKGLRDEAWRTYLGLPNLGMYEKLPDGTYTINLDIARKIDPDLQTSLSTIERGRDSFFNNHGGLWGSRIRMNNDETKAIWTMEDMWDLNPFRRNDQSVEFRLYKTLKEISKDLKMYKLRDKFEDLGQKALLNNHKFLDFEVGPILGGKPFYTKIEVPLIKNRFNYHLGDLSKSDIDEIMSNKEIIYRDASKKIK